MMEYSVKQICEITGGKLLFGSPDTLLHHITFDSRTMLGDDLFVPVPGEKVDGHRFIGGAFACGAAASLTAKEDAVPSGDALPEDRAVILVDDTFEALQTIGRVRREQELKMPMVGITGSVGKTTTREMTMAALSAGGRVTGSIKNMNSQLGVPVTLCHMDETADFAVAEMGISLPGEMERLAAMVQPDVAVVTNIGVAHIENLGSREGICREKMKITERLPEGGAAVLNGDEPLLREFAKDKPFRTVFYGLGEGCDVTAKDIDLGESASFTAVFAPSLYGEEKEVFVQLTVPGEHHVVDALAALAAAAVLGVDAEDAAAELASFGGFARRWERIPLESLLLIDDSYNANPVSMKASLASFARVAADRRIAVLADMLELGPDGPAMHRSVGEFAAALPIDLFITYGTAIEEADAAISEAGKNVLHAKDAEDAARILGEIAAGGDAVLLKGSNSMHLDIIRKRLSEEMK
ncbi:MAG: UDP-N-acetylmuramoyl-tripeptide--D-alanyl-D-alanine ligase [Lachnospiraceae bacterium]|nr:UDP-N-acetylmuramoyl-tripeptide--D-alanyl-D-alanine ligase [Lachnospiraceae bacterium]